MLSIYRENPHPYPGKDYDLFQIDLISDNLRLWKKAYYEGKTAVEDSLYDLWWRNLLFYEKKYPEDVRGDSPTINPGYDLQSSAT